MAAFIKYPTHMHKRGRDPKRVDNKSEMDELKNRGWKNQYIWTEFPKSVDGVIVKTKEEEELLLAAKAKMPKVIVDKKVLDASGQVIADSGPVAPILTSAPLTGAVQVADLEAANKALEQKVKDLEQEKKDEEEFKRLEAEEALLEAEAKLNEGFEMLDIDGEPIDGLHYATWPEAQAAQKDLNANAPGHKARKIEG
jgi:hypothetical protein